MRKVKKFDIGGDVPSMLPTSASPKPAFGMQPAPAPPLPALGSSQARPLPGLNNLPPVQMTASPVPPGTAVQPQTMKKGGRVKKMSSGGSTSKNSRGDGCAVKGKTRGRMR